MKRSMLFVMFAGFVAGTGGAAAYLLVGGDYFLFIPRWAEMLFYPGFVAGNWVFDQTHEETFAKVVGVWAVGFAYGLSSGLLWWAWTSLKSSKAHAASGEGNLSGRI